MITPSRQQDSGGRRVSPSYHAGELTWTEHRVPQPASAPEHRTLRPAGPPKYKLRKPARPAAPAPSRQGSDAGHEPSRTPKRPLSRIAATDPARFEALMVLLLVVLVAVVFAGIQFVN